MPTYSDLESDSGRLPEGFERTGYDADTETYTYTAGDGSSYSGLPGNRYGRLYPTGSAAYREALQSDDPWVRDIQKKGWWQREDWRYLSPFLLIVGVVLVSLFWWIGSGKAAQFACGTDDISHVIKHGDSCWAVAQEYKVEVGDLRGPYQDGNERQGRTHLQCDKLKPGNLICVLKIDQSE